MISTTWTKAPADLLGMGGIDVRPAYGPGLCGGSADLLAVQIAAPTAPAQGTGLPAGSTAVRLRPVTRRPIGDVVVTKHLFENNGTTLGIHSSRRPQS
ncbi:hypothetical protein ACI78T_16055 [Blastococcus sp. SYSU D00922]